MSRLFMVDPLQSAYQHIVRLPGRGRLKLNSHVTLCGGWRMLPLDRTPVADVDDMCPRCRAQSEPPVKAVFGDGLAAAQASAARADSAPASEQLLSEEP